MCAFFVSIMFVISFVSLILRTNEKKKKIEWTKKNNSYYICCARQRYIFRFQINAFPLLQNLIIKEILYSMCLYVQIHLFVYWLCVRSVKKKKSFDNNIHVKCDFHFVCSRDLQLEYQIETILLFFLFSVQTMKKELNWKTKVIAIFY